MRFATVGLILVAATAKAQVASFTSIVAVDGNGAVVGPLAGESVTVAVNRQFILAGLTPAEFQGSGKVRFDGPNCTGNAYVASVPEALVPVAIITPPGHTAWIPHPTDTTPRTIAQQSELEGFPDTRGCLEIPNPGAPPMQVSSQVPAIKAAELDVYFTPPFHAVGIRAGGCCGDCNGDGIVTVDELIKSAGYALHGCEVPR